MTHRWEVPALLASLAVVVGVVALAIGSGAISDPLPPCNGEARIAGTCRGENAWGTDA